MQQKIIEIIAEIKQDPSLRNKLNGSSDFMNDAALDSLQIISFILNVEEAFGIEVDFDSFDLDHLNSVDRFCEFVGQLSASA
ncbi:acyl carrier protein [Paenibacillus polymyxa]|uniref:acyl carrier protein n=1 Tax=Paenibacillus polymyxa TaxID=1406 RepID=UPI002AB577EA|nr:acyl carrier protein [Paenibacillus polymyxa]MDY8023279.1 acyl carrier protein [Paenibacillus polymyxa]